MKIICVGRNYVNHAKELGNEIPTEPMFFMKPSTALTLEHIFKIPEFSKEIHYELELVILINQTIKNVSKEDAHLYYDQIGLGIDFTARDLQMQLKTKGHPWEKAKAFDHSAFVTNLVSINDLPDKNSISFELLKNNETVQIGNSKNMIFGFDELISTASEFFTLEKGDLIFTGTPEGVGRVDANDILIGILEGKKMFSMDIKS